jgi:hypothetical protein
MSDMDGYNADKHMFLEIDQASKARPGLYKVESEASCTIAIAPKCVIHNLINGKVKSSLKGCARSDPLRYDSSKWMEVLDGGDEVACNLKSMRRSQAKETKACYTYYECSKVALSNRYDKRQLLGDEDGNMHWTAPRRMNSKLAPVVVWDSRRTCMQNIDLIDRSKRWMLDDESYDQN